VKSGRPRGSRHLYDSFGKGLRQNFYNFRFQCTLVQYSATEYFSIYVEK
jgi:hypothetical protein